MKENLTKKQKLILDFIISFEKKNDYIPSISEIGEHFNLSSPATVHEHLETLKRKGYLEKEHNKPRSIRFIVDERKFSEDLFLNLAGLITAGSPIEAVEQKESISVPAWMIDEKENSYLLKVKGESMIEDGIFDGDFVIVEKNPSPQNGDTVVALIDQEYATLKKFFKEKGRIRLQPANKTMEPIYVESNLIIQGVVKGILRKYK